MSERKIGKVAFWDSGRGHGRIRVPGSKDGLRCHYTALPNGSGNLIVGERISFAIVITDRGAQASDVQFLDREEVEMNESERREGVVTWWDEERRYGKIDGFIRCHADELLDVHRDLAIGDQVTFLPARMPKGWRATQVRREESETTMVMETKTG